ncbi:MAG: RnfABCDGE type electron transport complex subunit G [Pseudomonadales bacterium]|jgi:electron transport complex protein RnfG|nr:RnfABCDGE type electron transport complex subunit G [Pseudomonadales bacterium]
MNDQYKNQLPHPLSATLRLGALALGIGTLLILVYTSLLPRIAAARHQAALDTLAAALPPTPHDNDLLADSFLLDPAAPRFMQQQLLGLSHARPAYLTRQRGAATGVILPLETNAGFGGPIVLLIGLDRDGAITGVRTLTHSETVGLGNKIELAQSDWMFNFDQRSLANTAPPLWAVKHDGGTFDQFVGATITPRAVVNAVHQALEFFALNREALLTLAPAQDYPP